MRHYEIETNYREFYEKITPIVVPQESREGLLYGLSSNLYTQSAEKIIQSKPFALYLKDNGNLVACCLQSSRAANTGLVLSHHKEHDITKLVDICSKENCRFGGVIASPDLAQKFAKQWSERAQCQSHLASQQFIYELTEVIFPKSMPEGVFYHCTMEDFDVLKEHLIDFSKEALPHEEIIDQKINESLIRGIQESKFRYAWKLKGQLVSSASFSRPTSGGISIGPVYTPPQFRGKGYASALVACMSQLALTEKKKKFCTLYTDATNPTSNKIYQNIGYRHITDSAHYLFKP